MADTQTRVILTAVDNVTATLNRIEGSVTGVTGKFAGLGSTLGAIGIATGVTAAVSALTSMVTGAINAADAIGEMAQRTGVSGETLSRFQLAANNSGTSLEGLGGALQKLNVKMDDAAGGGKEASEAFARLGISVKDNEGKLKSTESVLLEVAGKFSVMEDGAQKTAIAVALFGKAGADMIPFLNQGAEGLEKAAQMADALGLTLSASTIAAADKTSDAMGMVSAMMDGFANKVMAAVLPTLLTLIEGFAAFVVETGALDVAAKAVAGTFNVLVNAGQIVGAVFKLVLNNVSTTASALMQIAQGEFGKAWDTVKTGVKNAGDIVIGTGQDIAKVWTRTTEDVLRETGKATGGVKKLSIAHKDSGDAAKAAAKEEKALSDALAEASGINKDYAEKVARLEQLWKSGRLSQEAYTEAVKKLALEQPIVKANIKAEQEALEKLNAEEKKAEETRKRVEAIRSKAIADIYSETEKIREQIIEQRSSNEQIGKTKTELEALELARMDDRIAMAEQRAEGVLLVTGMGDEWTAINDQVAALKLLKGERQKAFELQSATDAVAAAKEAGEAANKEWAAQSETVEKSLTDALMRGFESGKGFVENLAETATNLFKTLILRPTIQAIVSPISAGVTSMLGIPGAANAGGGSGGATSAGGGIGDLASMVSAASGLFGAGGITGALSAGAGWMTGATTFGGAMSAAGSLIGSGSAAGMASGLAMGGGAVLPVVGIALLAYSLLKNKRGGPKSGGSSVINTGSGLEDGSRLFTPSNDDATLQALTGGYSGALSSLAGGLGGSAASFTSGLGYDTDPQGTASDRVSAFLMDARGQSLYDVRDLDLGRDADIGGALTEQVSRMLLAGLKASNLPATYAEYFAQFDPATLSSGQADAALAAASSARALYDSTISLGGVFNQVGGLSVEARNGLVAMTGGLEQFLQLVSGYVASYYTSEEQTGLAAAGVLSQLQAAGFTGQQLAGLDTKTEFRALVDSLDISGETGQRQLSALLSVSDEFASIAAYLGENSLDLSGAAALSPGGPMFEELVRGHEIAMDTQTVQTDMLEVNREQVAKLDAQITQTAAAFTQVTGMLGTITTLLRTQTSSTLMQEALP